MTKRTNASKSIKQKTAFWLWSAIAVFLIYTTTITTDTDAQIVLGTVLISLLIALRRSHRRYLEDSPLKEVVRLVILVIGAYLTLRYLFWRMFFTISDYDILSFIASMLLFLAELYAISIYLLGMFVTANPLLRDPKPLPDDPREIPTVDIFVTTFDEEPDTLEVTLLAASQIRYPKDKLNIYLLDDGGTEQKCEHPDPGIAHQARQRREVLQKLCNEIGIHYQTRKRNEHAKAGNINAALKVTTGEFILILDTDHVPTVDILEETVGWFLHDPKLFLVQTPHFFVSPDPIERNLGMFERLPSENEMFYTVIQRGLDFWNASFFCGSAAVLRREALQQAGGLPVTSITEDADTALALHSQGYRSAYLRRPMVSGLQPTTFTSFVRQRVRWAQGMVQIFMLRNPLTRKGLRLEQRLSYLNSVMFWFFGYARIIFLLAPVTFLLFGLKIYDANLKEILAYAMPHLIGAILVSNAMYGKVRWIFISELYEHMLSLFTTIGVTKAIRDPHSPTFNVTPKNEQLDEDTVSQMSPFFYGLLALTVVSLIAGIYRYINYVDDRDVVIITMIWETFNLAILICAIGALLERRQRRDTPRIPVELEGRLNCNGKIIPCALHDLSVGGACVSIAASHLSHFDKKEAPLQLHTFNEVVQKHMIVPVDLIGKAPLGDEEEKEKEERVELNLRFAPETLEQRTDIVTLVHGSSERWRSYLKKRNYPASIFLGIWFLAKAGTKHTVRHFLWGFSKVWQHASSRCKSAIRNIYARV